MTRVAILTPSPGDAAFGGPLARRVAAMPGGSAVRAFESKPQLDEAGDLDGFALVFRSSSGAIITSAALARLRRVLGCRRALAQPPSVLRGTPRRAIWPSRAARLAGVPHRYVWRSAVALADAAERVGTSALSKAVASSRLAPIRWPATRSRRSLRRGDDPSLLPSIGRRESPALFRRVYAMRSAGAAAGEFRVQPEFDSHRAHEPHRRLQSAAAILAATDEISSTRGSIWCAVWTGGRS